MGGGVRVKVVEEFDKKGPDGQSKVGEFKKLQLKPKIGEEDRM